MMARSLKTSRLCGDWRRMSSCFPRASSRSARYHAIAGGTSPRPASNRRNVCTGPVGTPFQSSFGEVVRLFHPLSDDREEHFEWQGSTLVCRTPIGRGHRTWEATRCPNVNWAGQSVRTISRNCSMGSSSSRASITRSRSSATYSWMTTLRKPGSRSSFRTSPAGKRLSRSRFRTASV